MDNRNRFNSGVAHRGVYRLIETESWRLQIFSAQMRGSGALNNGHYIKRFLTLRVFKEK